MASQNNNPELVAVASDTDESEPSFSDNEDNSKEGGKETPLVAAVSDDEEEQEYAEMNAIDGDSDEEQEGENGDGSEAQGSGGEEEDGEEAKEEEGAEGEDDDDEAEGPVDDEFTNATPLPCISDEPAEEYDWKEIVLARMCLYGNAEACVQAVVMQTKDGTESGCADKSVSKNDLTKERIKEEYIIVEQPMGYVTRVTGYHSKPGTPCLLHSLRLDFASGQVIEMQGETNSYKGEPFVVQNLEDNFYLATIDFEEGKCIGYSGYHTDRPLAELMEEESLPDPDMLDEAQEHSEYDGLPASSNRPKVKPPRGDDDGSWFGDGLPAKETPEPPPDEGKSWRVSHICLSGDPCIRSAIIHYYDGKRFGYLLKEDLSQTHVHDHAIIQEANGRFIEVRQPGGYITKITGYQMLEGSPGYLAHSLQLEFASGQVIGLQGHGDADVWKGKYFSYTPPEDFYIYELKFNGEGNLSSVVGIRTEEMNFPDMDYPEIDEGKKKKCCFCC